MAAGDRVRDCATAVGDVPSAVRDGVTGLLVPRRDEAALGHSLCEVLQDAAAAERMGLCGREVAEAEYDIRRMVAEHAEAYGAGSDQCRR
jgi:glycosyltransferase involved in cell wall biosynthesis